MMGLGHDTLTIKEFAYNYKGIYKCCVRVVEEIGVKRVFIAWGIR